MALKIKPSLPGTDETLSDLSQRVGVLEAVSPPSGSGIDFNKTNDHDGSGGLADYLYMKLIGGTPLDLGGFDYSYFLESDQDGTIAEQLNGDGAFLFDNTGNGAVSGFAGFDADYGGKDTTGSDSLIGFGVLNTGDGALLLRNEGGITVIDNNGDGVYVTSTGQDINFVSIKLDIVGGDFLIQDEQAVTRDGSGVVTAIVPGDSLLRITNEGGGVWSYHIKTGAAWVADL